MEILLKLIIPNFSCYIGSYHGELFRPVLVRAVPTAETKKSPTRSGLLQNWFIFSLRHSLIGCFQWTVLEGDSDFFHPGVFPRILCWLERKRRHLMDMSGGGTCHFLPHFIGQTQSHNHNRTQGRMAIIDYACAQEKETKRVNMWPVSATYLQ